MGQNLQKVWVNQSHGVYGLKKEEGEKPEIQLLSKSKSEIRLYQNQKSEETQKSEEKP